MRKTIYLALFKIAKLLGINYPNVIVLAYHGISNDSWKFNISEEVFKKQIEFLKTNFKFISIEELKSYLNNEASITTPSVLVTFDDGYKNLLLVKDFLAQNNIKPTLFALSEAENVNKNEIDNNNEYLSNDEIKELVNAGWTIGSHGATHADFTNLAQEELDREISKSKEMLTTDYFSYPKGNYNFEVIKKVRDSGYELAFSMNDGLINKNTNKFVIPRIGVDASHSYEEFQATFSKPVIIFRMLVKSILPKKAINKFI